MFTSEYDEISKKFFGEKYDFIGAGAEGRVFKIASALVAKIWNNDFSGFSGDHVTLAGVLTRWQKINDAIPESLRVRVRIPEIVGAEIINDRVVTYHEYINIMESEDDNKDAVNLFNALYEQLNQYFVDIAFPNMGYDAKNKMLVLVDVWVRRY